MKVFFCRLGCQKDWLKILGSFLLSLFFLYSVLAPAELPPPNAAVLVKQNGLFNVVDANERLDQINQLSTRALNVEAAARALNALIDLRKKATECAQNTEKEMTEIDTLWAKSTPEGAANTETLTTLQQYLKNKKNSVIQRQSECQLFILHVDETIATFNNIADQANKDALLKAKPTLVTRFSDIAVVFQEFSVQFDGRLWFEQSGLSLLDPMAIGVLCLLVMGCFILTIYLKRKGRAIFTTTPQTFSEKMKVFFVHAYLKQAFWHLFSTMFLLFSLSIALINDAINTYLVFVSVGLFTYITAIFLVNFLFYADDVYGNALGLSKAGSQALLARLKFLLSIGFLAYIGYVFLNDQHISALIVNLIRVSFITLFSIGLISILWLSNRIPRLVGRYPIARSFISLILTGALSSLLIIEWFGYQSLVIYLLQGIALTLISGFVAVLLHNMIAAFWTALAFGQKHWQISMRRMLGVHHLRMIFEFMVLRLACYLLIWIGFFLVLLKIWQASPAHFYGLLNFITVGFKSGHIHIIPLRVFSAMIFFSVAALCARLLRNYLENTETAIQDKGTQQALSAIVAYASIFFIWILTFLIAGINLAGLALVAGALSVGIGFGLQNISNNFISGIILLLERPFKPGDRIIVGNVEGYIKKINIRFTQLQTLQCADLIIPNADMTSSQVTNLTFRDHCARTTFVLSVIYGTDIDLARQLFLTIANHHPAVIRDNPQYAPSAALTGFGENGLILEFSCIIHDVSIKYMASSEIRVALYKAFQANRIEIACPQRDVHIRDCVKSDPRCNNLTSFSTAIKDKGANAGQNNPDEIKK
ncbi:MAG: hypothetical protein A2X77_00845 [Gammaproteobacteria bacterium GWE2_42_36]|nr:MAG: hypothetical protein A2X77_00845 [Gammaproteobacteria bacterium GWE2_42_36]